MSDMKNKPSMDSFLNDFNNQLDRIIAQNAENLQDLLNRNDPMVNRTVRGVYQDFFGPDGVDPAGTIKGTVPTGTAPGTIPVVGNTPSHAESTGAVENAPSKADNAADKETAVTQATADSAAVSAPAEPEKSGMEKLKELTGLQNIKHDVAELVALAKVRKMREEKGLRFVPTSLHLVFAGNPGTGKTTVARILAQLYKEIGILSGGQLVEVDRSGLVAGFVGQTATKTQEKIQEAMGGILFIDEAYTLSRVEGNDFGQEAIDTILKAMEDHRDDFIVIVAGYTDLMEDFINSNPGLKSRFNKYFYFQDYTAEELMTIFESNCRKYSYTITDEVKEQVRARIEEDVENKDDNFANARHVRNIFEEIITNQATRVAEMESPTEEDLTTILPEDLVDRPELGNERAEDDTVKDTDAEAAEADVESAADPGEKK